MRQAGRGSRGEAASLCRACEVMILSISMFIPDALAFPASIDMVLVLVDSSSPPITGLMLTRNMTLPAACTLTGRSIGEPGLIIFGAKTRKLAPLTTVNSAKSVATRIIPKTGNDGSKLTGYFTMKPCP